jgi:cytochrome P450
VRRCLGASFAQFEINVVLRELVARLEIRPARPRPERRVRRAIVCAPERGGELVVERRAGGRAAGAIAA